MPNYLERSFSSAEKEIKCAGKHTEKQALPPTSISRSLASSFQTKQSDMLGRIPTEWVKTLILSAFYRSAVIGFFSVPIVAYFL